MNLSKRLILVATFAAALNAPAFAEDPEPIDFGPTEKLVILSESGAKTFDVEMIFCLCAPTAKF